MTNEQREAIQQRVREIQDARKARRSGRPAEPAPRYDAVWADGMRGFEPHGGEGEAMTEEEMNAPVLEREAMQTRDRRVLLAAARLRRARVTHGEAHAALVAAEATADGLRHAAQEALHGVSDAERNLANIAGDLT